MDIRFHTLAKGQARLDAGIVPTVQGPSTRFVRNFEASAAQWLAGSSSLADHSGKKGEVTVCHGPASSAVSRIILTGIGPGENILLEDFHMAIAAAVRRCKTLRLSRVGILLEDLANVAETLGKPLARVLEETVYAALLSVYSCTEYRSAEAKMKGKKENNPEFFEPDSLTIFHGGKAIPAMLRLSVKTAEADAAGVFLARNLANAPANIMTPARVEEEAVSLAKRHGFGCRVLHKAEMAKLGMGALLAVNQGAGKEGRFIILEHFPGGSKKRPPLVLAGKGITFDSGGISLKPAPNMHYMKGDMAGAAAVLGAFESIGRFPDAVACPVVGLIPCAENMPDGNAMRPGDIVTTMSGKTVEILNTDAEGRLLLCDALTYAQKNWKPLALVDIATLTGACTVALGRGAAGVFTDSPVLRDTIMDIGLSSGETFWPMPLWERLRESLTSTIADIANVGSREGGAITAALFLQSFVESSVPWAHIDMAGAAATETETPMCPKGATGFGARTLVFLARRVSEKMFR